MSELHVPDRDPFVNFPSACSRGRDGRPALLVLATVVVVFALGACGSSGSSTSLSAPDTTAAPITATTLTTVPPITTVTTTPPDRAVTTEPPVTTMPVPTFTLYTTLPVPETTVPTPVITAPPGRLPPVDDTGTITALFPTPFPVQDPKSLSTETILRLRASFEAAGLSADVAGLSLVAVESDNRPLGSVMAFVVEVRNQEASGDDSSPGYDMIVTMERGDDGNWTVKRAVRQQICSRGVSMTTDPPLCV